MSSAAICKDCLEKPKITKPSHYYKLEGRTPVAVATFEEWSTWRASNHVQIALTLTEAAVISTVFLGLNQRLSADKPPLVFETLVSSDKGSQTYRYTTWDKAIQGHCKQVSKLLATQSP